MEEELSHDEELFMRKVITLRRARLDPEYGDENLLMQDILKTREILLSKGSTEERLAYLAALVSRAAEERRLDAFEEDL